LFTIFGASRIARIDAASGVRVAHVEGFVVLDDHLENGRI
jgi:hypothetical protein